MTGPPTLQRTLAAPLATSLGAVALAAASCTGGSGEALEGATVESFCEAWCAQREQCFPEAFQADYGGSIETCRQACEQDAGAFYDGYHTPECVDEALAKDLCVAGLSCEQLAASDYESCQDEHDALDECLGYLDGGT